MTFPQSSWALEVSDPQFRTARTAFDALAEQDRAAILDRANEVRAWVGEFAKSLRVKAPRLQVGAYAAYYPLSHSMSLSIQQFLKTPDDQLRIVVAHEMGHASRRWRCVFARSMIARLEEEVAADRIAADLTGCTVAEWDAAMQGAESTEPSDPSAAQVGRLVWQGRRKRLATYISKKKEV